MKILFFVPIPYPTRVLRRVSFLKRVSISVLHLIFLDILGES